ncbi:MAG: hypothetical protein KA885_14350 [Spirochaetes bacterium]|nr:hypothetical protein [Spirochaetota bacterium]
MDINLFNYDEDEMQIFPFIKIYSDSINDWLKSNKLDHNQEIRYMLASLYLLYKTCIHLGCNFSTEINYWNSDIHRKTQEKMKILNNTINKVILSTKDYLKEMNLDNNLLNNLFLIEYENGLFYYVINNKYTAV